MATSKNKRRYWGIVGPTMPADVLAQAAKQQEDIGLEGTFAAQVYGPPWVSLAPAATATSRLKLASGIALAFTRSPFEWEFADSMCLLPPVLTLPPEKSLEYFMTIAQTFY